MTPSFLVGRHNTTRMKRACMALNDAMTPSFILHSKRKKRDMVQTAKLGVMASWRHAASLMVRQRVHAGCPEVGRVMLGCWCLPCVNPV